MHGIMNTPSCCILFLLCLRIFGSPCSNMILKKKEFKTKKSETQRPNKHFLTYVIT